MQKEGVAMKRYILGIDEGTTSERVILFDTKTNKIVDLDAQSLQQFYPQNGWVEHDAEEIWSKVEKSLKTVIKRNRLKVDEIFGIGLTNQRETTVAFDKTTGKAICPAIVWQCRRTAPFCEKMDEKTKLSLQKKTGLIVDAYFSATKMKWILDNNKLARDLARKGQLGLCTIDAFLVQKLTQCKVFATDTTNASRTMLVDLKKPQQFDSSLLEFFDIPASCMPEIKNSADDFGFAKTSIGDIPILSVIGDQQASLFGQGCFSSGDAKITYGTGAFVLVNVGQKLPTENNNLLNTVAWTISNKTTYAVEGSVFNVGSTLNFLKNNLKLFRSYSELDHLCDSIPSNEGVYLIPAFTGLGAPYWNPQVRGKICGLTLSNTPAHIVRSAMESFCYSVFDIIDYLSFSGRHVKQISVDGGVSKSQFLLQFQSNLLQIPVSKVLNNESTALGAIYLAGLYSGAYLDFEDIKSKIEIESTTTPSCTKREMKPLVENWRKYVCER